MNQNDKHQPIYAKDDYSERDQELLKPFFTNLDSPVYSPLIFSPEVIGALCSRTSRATDDLRKIFLEEYIKPFTDSDNPENQEYGEELRSFINYLTEHPIEQIFSNPRARSFYNKWLAQYGDDSIAQMAGSHLVYNSISQVAIKHLEDQRIGLAPIEKSTRYVDFGQKIDGQYRYYTDPKLTTLGLEQEYRAAMDGLFDTYLNLMPKISSWLKTEFPEETDRVIGTKSFDTLRGLLPTSTLSQVALFGNGQAFEYMIARSLKHRLGEIRWAAEQGYNELNKIVPSFLRRLKTDDIEMQQTAEGYQEYKAGLADRMSKITASLPEEATAQNGPSVSLLEHDPEGEEKIIAGLLYNANNNHRSWQQLLNSARSMSVDQKKQVFDQALDGRTQRWQKVPRAFENAFVRYEISMNIGAWRDVHRHRMLSQQRQQFTVSHGYDTPPELINAGLDGEYRQAIERVEDVYRKIAQYDQDLAQYSVAMAHRVRFMQYKNLRECFWEMELRTIPEGHPDYRVIEQEKFKLLEQVYPTLASYMHVNMGNYDFARRGQEEKIQAKLDELEKIK